jgi:hypothetical protein
MPDNKSTRAYKKDAFFQALSSKIRIPKNVLFLINFIGGELRISVTFKCVGIKIVH